MREIDGYICGTNEELKELFDKGGYESDFCVKGDIKWREASSPCWGKRYQYRLKSKEKLMPAEEWDNLAKENNQGQPALDVQVGGNHYKAMKIQPVEFITANSLGFIEGSIIKYVCRHKAKNGKQDLEKARHFLDLLIELEYTNAGL